MNLEFKIYGRSLQILTIFWVFITHSLTNSSIVVRCHCRTTLPDSCLRLMVFQSRRSLFNSSNCKTSKSMMCEAPIQMSSNKHKFYTYFSKIKCRDVVKVLFLLEACFDLISKIQIMGGKITENLGFKSPLQKVKKNLFFFLFIFKFFTQNWVSLNLTTSWYLV